MNTNRRIFLLMIFICLTSKIAFADNILCPEQMVCKSDNDINSCQCRTGGVNLTDWYPTIIDESHVYKGVYLFHNAQVKIPAGEKTSSTYCMQQYYNPHADDKLLCVYKGSNLKPALDDAMSVWKVYLDAPYTVFYCGDFNHQADRSTCIFKAFSEFEGMHY